MSAASPVSSPVSSPGASPIASSSESTPGPLLDSNSLPGPKGLPLLGVARQIDRDAFHLQLEGWFREYGGRYTFKLGPKRMVVFADSASCRDVLRRRPDEFRRGKYVADLIDELGARGVFSSEGASWKKQRKLIMPGFNQSQLQHFFPQIQTITDRLHRVWDKAAASDELWDFRGDFERFTTDVTTSIAFGHDVNSVEGGRDLLQTQIEQIFPALHRRMSAAFPLWRYIKLPAERRVEAAARVLRDKLEPIIDAARERVAQHPGGPDPDAAETLLEAMIAAEMLDPDNEHFSNEEVYGNVLTVLLAGEDTTAHTLAWIAHALVSVDGVQAKLQAELDAVLDSDQAIVDMAQQKRLPYLNGVIQEALRLRSVAPLMFYEAYKETQIDGVRVAPGEVVVLLTRLAALKAEHFSEPEAFLPERWIRDDDAASSRCPVHQPKAMLPFGSGPRICPGRGLSLLEMNIAIARLCRNFTVEAASDPAQVEEVFAFTMHPRGFSLRLRPRR